jgi:hypothetical protein
VAPTRGHWACVSIDMNGSVVGGLVVLSFLFVFVCLPLLAGTVGVVGLVRSRRFRARAARIMGTVVQSPVEVSESYVAVPSGGVVPMGARFAARPVVAYAGPNGEQLAEQVRYPAREIFVYGQPVALLVDPMRPRDVRLVTSTGGAQAWRWILVSVVVSIADVVMVVLAVMLVMIR